MGDWNLRFAIFDSWLGNLDIFDFLRNSYLSDRVKVERCEFNIRL
jgi:hypothetical protein